MSTNLLRVGRVAALFALTTCAFAHGTEPDEVIEAAVIDSLRTVPGETVSVVVALSLPRQGSNAEYRSAIEETQELVLASFEPGEFALAYRYRTFPALAGRVNAEGLARLGGDDLVARVGPNTLLRVLLDGSVAHINADDVQAMGYDGEGITVAVLDTGIDTDHPDLADDLADGAMHFLGDGSNIGPGAEDDHGHGTHVSGIISSAGNVGPLGVAPATDILAIKALDSGGGGSLTDILGGIDYITSVVDDYDDLCAINMSLATILPYSSCPCDNADTLTTTLQAALQAAKDAGITPFAATGNGYHCSSMGAPACLSSVTAVAAVFDEQNPDHITAFSDRSPCNELAAPGDNIHSSTLGGGSGSSSGTSMACPHAAATAALMRQFSGSYCTDLAPGDLVQILKDTGVPTVDSCGSSPNPLRIDALAAIDSIGVPGGSGTVFCQGDGSLTPCPCGNESATPIPCGGGAGCVNSSGEGAGAAANGSPSVSADDLIVDGARLLPAQPALCFAGTVQLNGGAGIPFGDGLRCAGASVIRLGTQNADAAGAASWGPGLAATGGWSPGDQRYLQLWYRDPTGSPCGSGFNLSNGLAVSFTP